MNNSPNQLCNFEAAQIPQPQPQPQPDEKHKKQVRRRRQSRRLCREMPLNMAEARREIVSALKLHRASAKQHQQKHDHHHINQPPRFPPLLNPSSQPQPRMKSRRNLRIYPASSSDSSGSQPLVEHNLNLNFDDDFKAVDACSFYSLSFESPSSYLCPTVSSYAAAHQEEVPQSVSYVESQKQVQGAVDEEPMAEIRSMDVKPLEIDAQFRFDKPIKFPDWLSITDDFLQQNLNYHCVQDDYLQDPELSCLDIGEIEDVDGDWLA